MARTTTPPPQVRVAVLIRGHKIDDKLRHMHAHLDSPDAQYDLFLLLNQTNGPIALDACNVVEFSQQRISELGLSYAFPKLFHLCGDIALFFAMRDLPKYSHFIMIDYDVHFVRSGSAMLNALVARLRDPTQCELDAIGLQYSIINPGWEHYEKAAQVFGDVRFINYPFVRLSRRALAYLNAQRRLERMNYKDGRELPLCCEAFVPGHLASAGFHCIDLLDVLPGSYESVARDSSMRLVPYGLPLGASIAIPPAIEMIHPVYSVADYLWRLVEFARTPDAIAAIRDQLRGPTRSFIDPALREQCDRQLAAKLEQMVAQSPPPQLASA